jgi:hypothetical protein
MDTPPEVLVEMIFQSVGAVQEMRPESREFPMKWPN